MIAIWKCYQETILILFDYDSEKVGRVLKLDLFVLFASAMINLRSIHCARIVQISTFNFFKTGTISVFLSAFENWKFRQDETRQDLFWVGEKYDTNIRHKL